MIYDDHALEQFVTRYDRRLSHEQALRLLEHSPRFKAERTRAGDQYYDVPELGVRLVTKLWRGGKRNGREVCITVVKRVARRLSELELELMQEAGLLPAQLPSSP